MASPDKKPVLPAANEVEEDKELRHLKEALARSYTERFLFATRLYKIQQTLLKATVSHKPDNLNK